MKIKDGILEFNGANVPISERKDPQNIPIMSPLKNYTNIPALFITINVKCAI